jgi:hypothetical protein
MEEALLYCAGKKLEMMPGLLLRKKIHFCESFTYVEPDFFLDFSSYTAISLAVVENLRLD